MISARIILTIVPICLAVAVISLILTIEVWRGFKVFVVLAVLGGAVSVAVGLIAQLNGTLENDLQRRPRK